ncbi:MAG: RNA pseudouridine synthase, partial [bacterium]
ELEVTAVEARRGFTIVDVRLVTGRKHQIRAQLAHRGCPVAGDALYGARSRLGDGVALVCRLLRFRHPVEPDEVVVEVPDALDPVPAWLAELGAA